MREKKLRVKWVNTMTSKSEHYVRVGDWTIPQTHICSVPVCVRIYYSCYKEHLHQYQCVLSVVVCVCKTPHNRNVIGYNAWNVRNYGEWNSPLILTIPFICFQLEFRMEWIKVAILTQFNMLPVFFLFWEKICFRKYSFNLRLFINQIDRAFWKETIDNSMFESNVKVDVEL